ncbi:the Gp42 Transglutaminase from phytophthora Sojae [Catenaria anguillulae PL171]|uniref:The Gp42 Transglutaminase from phytophthora Sojae n=1 Tax=Catenaria anguillulae PL171 TaxID=765915 RepID=A0A1Y2HKN5_9FUNG|nr:the Gp42 Transglutaminase from phytophthora Sojae [Catenaria anguillulae PL171]
MVSITTVLAVYATILLSVVSASPYESEPRGRGIADIMPLNHDHPARGAPIAKGLYKPIDVSGGRGSREEASLPNSDLRRLENHFRQPLERRFSTLPTRSEVSNIPWPGPYWPVYADSINQRWTNEPSPAEKYARAFGLDVTSFTNRISRVNGIDSQSGRRSCRSNADCRGLNDGSECGIRQGQTTGRCIPTWFGICHAWAPAAILEPEPKCPVSKNGVTFRPLDLKALMTLIYDGVDSPTVFTGNRFDGDDDAVPKDQYGRFLNAAYRDLNPGYFHVAFANIMGRFKQSFVIDVTAGAEVWNQPVRSFQVLEQRLMTPQQAAQTYFRGATSYAFNTNAAQVAYVKTRFNWIVESDEDGPHVSTGRVNQYTSGRTFEYLLELDTNGQIVGGEWLGASMKDHPDFLYLQTARPSENAVSGVGLSYRNVKELLTASANGRC